MLNLLHGINLDYGTLSILRNNSHGTWADLKAPFPYPLFKNEIRFFQKQLHFCLWPCLVLQLRVT